VHDRTVRRSVRAGRCEGCDGNADDTDACRSDCNAASCGDGFVQAGVEQCDDSNAASGDGCASCLFESKSYIVPIGDLINQAADCSDGTNRYNWDNVSAGGCFNTRSRWVDSTPFRRRWSDRDQPRDQLRWRTTSGRRR
jgi:cysteine-rich repeat protein